MKLRPLHDRVIIKRLDNERKTSSGIVSGIQWVPAEATSVLPSGAQPANDDFVSSWTRTGRLNAEEERSVKEW